MDVEFHGLPTLHKHDLVSERNAKSVGVELYARVASRAGDATPVGISAKNSAFDEVGRDDALGQYAGLVITLRPCDQDLNVLPRYQSSRKMNYTYIYICVCVCVCE